MKKVVLVYSIALIISCSSLPLPNSHDQSLYIIPYQIDNSVEGGYRQVRSITITLRNMGTDRIETVVFPVGSGHRTIALAPGRYSMFQAEIRGVKPDENNREWDHHHGIFSYFYIGANTIVLSRDKVFMRDQPSGGYHFEVGRYATSDIQKRRVLDEIRNDKRWVAWDGYNLVNFPN